MKAGGHRPTVAPSRGAPIVKERSAKTVKTQNLITPLLTAKYAQHGIGKTGIVRKLRSRSNNL